MLAPTDLALPALLLFSMLSGTPWLSCQAEVTPRWSGEGAAGILLRVEAAERSFLEHAYREATSPREMELQMEERKR